MICATCQHENRGQARFCEACGTPFSLAAACSHCGTELRAGARFCDACGASVSPAAGDEGQESAPPAPPTADSGTASSLSTRAYTPRHLAEKILSGRSALEGERKQVTVLFADIKGSTELADGLDPEEWHAILDRFFGILTEGVHRFEGTVNQYTGDGIMALFGAPIAHEDHAQRACYAALHLRDALRRYADEVRLERGLNLSTRIGLNSGEVVVGKIGDDLRMDYTAQGQVVNVAQRMEQLAESGRVYLTQHTANRVAGYFRLREIGPTQVKGLRDPIRVHDLDGVGEFQGRFDVSRARGLSKFIGREREMAVLETALERAMRGEGRLVGIVADAGTGKSRLTHEFGERCRARGLRVIHASCPPHGRATPLAFHMNASRSLFGVSDRDAGETARNKVAAFMSRMDAGLAADIPFMLDFLGLAEPGESSAPTDPEVRQRQFLRIIGRLIELRDYLEIGLLEDLHWMDPASQALNVEFNRLESGKPTLTVMNFRPEYRPPEVNWPNYEEIRLSPLTAESTGELLRDLLGPEATGCGLEAKVQRRAAGNPFFVEEIIQSLAESGHLDGTRGAYRLARPVDEIDVPDSVQAVLAARIDRLDESAKRVLQAASVIGLEFPIVIIEEVAAIPPRDLATALDVLTGADFLYQLTAYPEIEYAFKHPLTQAIAYDTQLGEPRRRTHGRIAGVLEQRHADMLDEKSGLIAYHWEEAGERTDGARWHARAAGWLETRDVEEALQHWQKVRSLLAGDGDLCAEEGELATVACTQILNLGWRQGMDEEEAARVFADGRKFAQGGGGARAHVLLLVSFAAYRGLNYGPEEMLDWNREALELAADLDDPSLALALATHRSLGLHMAGRLREALDVAERALERSGEPGVREARGVGGFHTVAYLTFSVGINRYLLGRFGEGRASLEESLALARQHQDPDTTCFASGWLVECCVAIGDLESALRHARAAVDVAEHYTSRQSGIHSNWSLGRALIAHDRPSEAAAVLERALAAVREGGIQLSIQAPLRQLLAEAHLGLGHLERAREECGEAIRDALRSGTPLYECDAHLVLAQVLSREGTSAPHVAGEVTTVLGRAAALIEQMGAESRRPLLEELQAELARARGDSAGRERHLREALRLCTLMGAASHAERLARDLAGLSR